MRFLVDYCQDVTAIVRVQNLIGEGTRYKSRPSPNQLIRSYQDLHPLAIFMSILSTYVDINYSKTSILPILSILSTGYARKLLAEWPTD